MRIGRSTTFDYIIDFTWKNKRNVVNFRCKTLLNRRNKIPSKGGCQITGFLVFHRGLTNFFLFCTFSIITRFLAFFKQNLEKGKSPNFMVDEDGMLRFQNYLCVSNKAKLKEKILTEAHDT